MSTASSTVSSPVLLSYQEAAALVGEYAARISRQPRPSERVDLSCAPGRVLARALCADRDQPPFARSTRDGFACRAAEVSKHGLLNLVGSSRAGEAPAGPLPEGAAWEIMTGAPVPAGADTVAMLEHVEISGKQIRLLPPRKVKAGENIVDRGAQAREGDKLLPVGAATHASQIALAASCGYAELEVFVRPRVAILTTGDELVPVESSPGPGQIRNSNAPMLAALVAASGGEPWVLPTAHDNADALDAALAQASQADMLLISGGVSAGKFDLVEPALARAGARFHFTGVRIQPGKPLVFGELPVTTASTGQNEHRTKCLFGHPGNPVSTAVTFLLFAAPVLRALAGSVDHCPRFALAQLAAGSNAHGKPGLTRFLPASCTFSATTGATTAGKLPEVALVPMQGSGDLVSLARSNCFLIVPEDAQRLDAGAIVRILLY